MPDLSNTFNGILANRQSQRNKFQGKLRTIQRYSSKYTSLANWIKNNKDLLIQFNSEVETSIVELEEFVNQQLKLIQILLGTSSSGQGVIKQLLSRIERSWVSFSAIGAKRQGKGHMLSTLLNLKPENDIFLARAGKPCTASVVTLYQGPKRKAIFKEDGTFDCWNIIAQNKAFVYFHTYDSMVSLILQYFDKLNIKGKFVLSHKDKSTFVEECNKWIPIVEEHNTNNAPVEYKELLLDYLINADKYAGNLCVNDKTEPLEIEVSDLPLEDGCEKIDVVNESLRKYISYYRRNSPDRHFDVLAVRKVDIYTKYRIGELESDSFVISDTAGIGEAKLNLRETLKDLLKNNIDIALAVTKVPDDSDEDLSIPPQVIDFHNTISSDNCFACFPLQFYYIINVRQSTLATYTETDINDFKNNLINHLKDRGLQIPSVGMIKPWNNTVWTNAEVTQWNETHVKIMDVDKHEELNEYFKKIVLPNVANDISVIDNELLKTIDNTIHSLSTNDSLLTELCNRLMGLVPMYDTDINDSKVAEIKEQILSKLDDDFTNLSKAIATISDLSERLEMKDCQLKEYQKETIVDCISKLYHFQSKIREFYSEPDWYRTIHAFYPKYELKNSDREECSKKKEVVYENLNDDKKKKELKNWEFNEWAVGNQERDNLLFFIQDRLITLSESLDADEIGTLATYRLKVLNELRTTTDNILNSLAAEAYILMVKMIWRSFYEDGRFAQIAEDKNDDNYKNAILCLLNEARKYDEVVKVLNTIDSKELSVIDKELRKKTHNSLAVSKIQDLTIRDLTSEDDIPKVMANAFWEHLVSIEWDYKMSVSRLFKKDAILTDFKKTFRHLIATIQHKLIEQDTKNEDTEKTQQQFLNFYLNNFQKVLPENNIAINIQVRNCIEELKELIK